MTILNKEIISREYLAHGNSDREIAKKYGVHRTTISKFRTSHGIESRVFSGEVGESLVKNHLIHLGFSVEDMNLLKGKTHSFDLLLAGRIRVEVKTAREYKIPFSDRVDWTFSLSEKMESGVKENEYHIKLPNGRLRKNLNKSCDIVILCAISDKDTMFFVIPPKYVPISQQSVKVSRGGKWMVWENRWDLIKKLL